MTHEKFEAWATEFAMRSVGMLLEKNRQYARDDNAHANFEETQGFLRYDTMEQALLPLLHKHYRAVVNAIQRGEHAPVESLMDITNYCIFLYTMSKETT